LIKHIISNHRKRLVTHAQWLYLLEKVLSSVAAGKPVSIHTLLSTITDAKDDDDQYIAKRLFVDLYTKEDLHTPKFYRACRNFAMKVLQRNIAIKLLRQEKILSDRVIRDTCKIKMPLLWKKLEDYKPCEAPYTGRGTSTSGNPVFCYQ